MSSFKRKRNLLDDKQKSDIISYAKENPKLTQQIADNLTFKWDLPIKRRIVGDILNQKEFYESDNEYSQIKSYDLYLLCTYLSVDINRQMEYTLYVNIYSNLFIY